MRIFIPLLVYRTGPYAPSGIPIANGYIDYLTLLNTRDGGVNGVKITWEECETQYDTKLGVECYERLKGRRALLVNPYSTGITYQLIPKAPVDKIVVYSMGYGIPRPPTAGVRGCSTFPRPTGVRPQRLSNTSASRRAGSTS